MRFLLLQLRCKQIDAALALFQVDPVVQRQRGESFLECVDLLLGCGGLSPDGEKIRPGPVALLLHFLYERRIGTR